MKNNNLTLEEFKERILKYNPEWIYNRITELEFLTMDENGKLLMVTTEFNFPIINKKTYKTDEFLMLINTLLRRDKILKLRSK